MNSSGPGTCSYVLIVKYPAPKTGRLNPWATNAIDVLTSMFETFNKRFVVGDREFLKEFLRQGADEGFSGVSFVFIPALEEPAKTDAHTVKWDYPEAKVVVLTPNLTASIRDVMFINTVDLFSSSPETTLERVA